MSAPPSALVFRCAAIDVVLREFHKALAIELKPRPPHVRVCMGVRKCAKPVQTCLQDINFSFFPVNAVLRGVCVVLSLPLLDVLDVQLNYWYFARDGAFFILSLVSIYYILMRGLGRILRDCCLRRTGHSRKCVVIRTRLITRSICARKLEGLTISSLRFLLIFKNCFSVSTTGLRLRRWIELVLQVVQTML